MLNFNSLLLLFRRQRVVHFVDFIQHEILDDRSVGINEVGEGLVYGGLSEFSIGVTKNQDQIVFVVVPVK